VTESSASEGPVQRVQLLALEQAGELYPGVAADAQAICDGLSAMEKRVALADGRSMLARLCQDPVSGEGGVLQMTDVSAFFRHHDNLARALAEVADYKHALDRSSIVSMTDREGRITHVNELFCAITGYRREELLGKNHRIVNSGFHPRAFMQELWETIGRGEVWSGTIRNQAKTGTYHWVYTTIVPFAGEDGRPERFLAIRNQVPGPSQPGVVPVPRRAEDVAEDWFDGAPVGVAMTDRAGTITKVNPAMLKLLDRATAQVVGQCITTFHPVKEQPGDGWEDVVEGRRESVVCAHQLTHPDGSLRWTRVTTWRAPATTGRPGELIHLFEDTTEVHTATEQLRAKSQLAQLGEMAAVVAHEVKNPLAGIGGALSIIADRMPTNSPERAIMGEIQGRLGQLNELVNGLVRYARPVEIDASPVVVADVISRVAARLQAGETTGPIVSEVVAGCTVEGDAALIEELFTHVVHNACRVNRPERGDVRVTMACRLGVCCIVVTDHGPGFAPELQERVFEPFFTTKNQGVGLGLAQARRIARAHGGEIKVVSSGPQGTCIEVSLPSLSE
ncbi:MAG: PAS domain-containing sensor histidine kinase, partial [Nannocystaceae bacterium]